MTDEKIDGLIAKAKEAGHRVLSVVVVGDKYIYRSINRSEWRALQKKNAEKIKPENTPTELATLREDGEDELVCRALLQPKVQSPQELHGLPAGVPGQLADLILRASGFATAEEAPVPIEL